MSMDASTTSATIRLVPEGSMFVPRVPAKISPSYGFTSMCSRTASIDRSASSRPLTRTAPSYAPGGTFTARIDARSAAARGW